MTDTTEATKKALAESQEATERSRKEAAEKMSKGRPTPTQEENDRAKLGEHITEHEDDGSGPDPYQTRQVEARKPSAAPSGYATRAASPASSRASSTKSE